MSRPMEGQKVGIIGGGPAGILCAAYMAKEGASVTVLERYDPSKDTESGQPRPWWNIGLSPISQTAIEGAGLSADFEPQFKPEGMAVYQLGKPATYIGTWDPEDDDAIQLALITQPGIVQHLTREAERVYGGLIRVQRGSQVVGGNICEGEVVVESAAGSQQALAFDLVVGADGLWSVARSLMQQHDPDMEVDIAESELYIFGCPLTPQGNPATYAALPTPSGSPFHGKPPHHDAPITGSSMAFIMTDPIANPGVNAVVLSFGDGGSNVAAGLSATREWFEEHGAGAEAQARAALEAAFAHMPTVWLEEIVAAVCGRESSGLRIRPLKFVNCSKIASGRAVLIGDAAHAMSPNLGMGCNSALVDAQVLGSCAAAAAGGGGGCAAVAAAYNAARLRDVRALTRISRKLNDAVNHPYHGSLRKLLWGAPVLLSMMAGLALKSPKTPKILKPRRDPMKLLHNEGKIRAAERSATVYFWRTVVTVLAVAGAVGFAGVKGAQGAAAVAGAGARRLHRA